MTDILAENVPWRDFTFIGRQRGLFMYLGLTFEQIVRLRNEFGIYVFGTGHICLAAITRDNINVVTRAIAQVI